VIPKDRLPELFFEKKGGSCQNISLLAKNNIEQWSPLLVHWVIVLYFSIRIISQNDREGEIMKKGSSEKGQALVLIVLALVVLFAFAGLALDGGRIYSERRRAQNAADAAAFAAASAAVNGQDFTTSGLTLASANGFDNNTTTNWVTISNPPLSGPYGPTSSLSPSERALYYQVRISQNIDPIFSQLFYGGQEKVTVEAVAKADDSSGYTGLNALISLDKTVGETGFEIDGNVTLIVHGGNTWSNNNGIKNGNSGNVISTTDYDTSHDKKPTDINPAKYGSFNFVGEWPTGKRDKMYGNFVNSPATISLPVIPSPYCPSGSVPQTETYKGVTYYLRDGGHLPATLSPGIWCIDGDLTSNTTGMNVLIVLLNGGIKYKGNGNLELTRDRDIIDKNGHQYGGMVIYAPPTNTEQFDLGGNSKSLFNGTVYAPGMQCDFGGTPANKSNHTAMVCNTIKIHGNPEVRIDYHPEQNYRLSPTIELSQ
jgi:hypothetical protein